MAEETARLNLRVDSSQVKKATGALKKLDSQSGKTEGATKSMTAGFVKMAGAIGLVATALSAATKLIDVARSFDVLNASLITVTGSAEAADAAFEQIQEFAATTPFALQEVANAFVKLTAFGLDPTEEAITALGNTASAMGKSLNQTVEALADAATGEFERLKEFGIKAKSEGDRVTFTFRGVATEVGKNAEEIENFVKSIGEVEFAGAMARRADTLDGAISNLSDTWEKLFLVIAQSGVGDLIEKATRGITGALNLAIEFLEGPSKAELLTAMEKRLATGIGVDKEVLSKQIAELRKIVDEEAAKGRATVADEKGALGGFLEDLKAQLELVRQEREVLESARQTLGPEAGQFINVEEQTSKILEIETAINEVRERLKTAQSEEPIIDLSIGLEEGLNLQEEAFFGAIDATIEFERQQTEIAQDAADERVRISELESIGRQAAIGNMFVNLSSLMNSENKKMFDIGKTAAIAETIINTHSAAMKAYSALAGIPIIGPGLGIAAALAAVAAGAVRVQAIQSTQFGSATVSGGAGATSGGTPVSQQLPPQPQGGGGTGQSVRVVFQNVSELVPVETVRNLIEQIAEVSEDMGGTVITVSG